MNTVNHEVGGPQKHDVFEKSNLPAYLCGKNSCFSYMLIESTSVQGGKEEAESKMCEIQCQRRSSGSTNSQQRHLKGRKAVLRLQWLRKRVPNRALCIN